MKINTLYIDKYKLLEDFSIDFNKGTSILIGINGSGKSSILESIAQIFSDAILSEKSKFGFKINYTIRLEEIIEQSATTSEFKTDFVIVEISSLKKGEDIIYKVILGNEVYENIDTIERRFIQIQKIFPSKIVIYYSGLSNLMKKICDPHNLILSKHYREGVVNIYRPFFYFEPALFNIILLSLLSYEFGNIPEYLSDKMKIKYLRRVQLKLKRPNWAKQQKIENWWGAKGEVKIFLDYLSSLAGSLIIDTLNDSKGNIVIEAWQNDNIK